MTCSEGTKSVRDVRKEENNHSSDEFKLFKQQFKFWQNIYYGTTSPYILVGGEAFFHYHSPSHGAHRQKRKKRKKSRRLTLYALCNFVFHVRLIKAFLCFNIYFLPPSLLLLEPFAEHVVSTPQTQSTENGTLGVNSFDLLLDLD